MAEQQNDCPDKARATRAKVARAAKAYSWTNFMHWASSHTIKSYFPILKKF